MRQKNKTGLKTFFVLCILNTQFFHLFLFRNICGVFGFTLVYFYNGVFKRRQFNLDSLYFIPVYGICSCFKKIIQAFELNL